MKIGNILPYQWYDILYFFTFSSLKSQKILCKLYKTTKK